MYSEKGSKKDAKNQKTNETSNSKEISINKNGIPNVKKLTQNSKSFINQGSFQFQSSIENNLKEEEMAYGSDLNLRKKLQGSSKNRKTNSQKNNQENIHIQKESKAAKTLAIVRYFYTFF